MRFTFMSLAAATIVVASAGAQAQTWGIVINEATTTAALGVSNSNTNLNALGGNGAGLFVAGNVTGTSRTIVAFNANATTASVITTDQQLVNAIAAVNGASVDPAASAVRFQGIGINNDGRIICYLDGSAMAAALLAIDPLPPHAINVLSTAVGGQTTAPVEGGNGFVLRGNTAYMLVDGGFSAAEDAVIAVDTSTIVNTGLAPVTTVVGQAALLAATGDTNTNNSLNDISFINATEAVVINSGATASNDNVIKVNVSNGTASLLVAATDIEADLGATDVGYSAVEVDNNGNIYLANMFGAGATDDSIITLTNITPPNATATAKLETTLVTELGGTDFFLGADGFHFEPVTGRLYGVSDGVGNSGLIRSQINPAASVREWQKY